MCRVEVRVLPKKFSKNLRANVLSKAKSVASPYFTANTFASAYALA
jgi:hypothetical protein